MTCTSISNRLLCLFETLRASGFQKPKQNSIRYRFDSLVQGKRSFTHSQKRLAHSPLFAPSFTTLARLRSAVPLISIRHKKLRSPLLKLLLAAAAIH
jgi:hypothetical protein